MPEIRVPLPIFADGISVALISRWDGRTPDLRVEITPSDSRLGNIPPAEAENNYYSMLDETGMAA